MTEFTGGTGVVLGYHENEQTGETHYLKHDDERHVIAFVPEQSVPTSGVAIPTLLSWEHSALVHDPKGEAWSLTSGYRAQELGQMVFNFDPANYETGKVDAYNPLAEIRLGTDTEVADAYCIADAFADPYGRGIDESKRFSRQLLAAVILHCRYARHTQSNTIASLKDVVEYLGTPCTDIRNRLVEMRDALGKNKGYHPTITEAAQILLGLPTQGLSITFRKVMSYITMFRDPILVENTRRSDWRINDLISGDGAASVYMVVRPPDKERLLPLIRLILTQAVRTVLDTMTALDDTKNIPAPKQRLLLMLDEFPSLFKLPAIESSLAYMSGSGVKAYLVARNIAQIEAVYGQGQDDTIIPNCHIRIFHPPFTHEDAVSIVNLSPLSRYQGVTPIPAITLPEIMRMNQNKDENEQSPGASEALILAPGHTPVKCSQALYFRDEILRKRSEIPPHH